jgi:hypothetical protein
MRGNCSPNIASTIRMPPTRVFIETMEGCFRNRATDDLSVAPERMAAHGV